MKAYISINVVDYPLKLQEKIHLKMSAAEVVSCK